MSSPAEQIGNFKPIVMYSSSVIGRKCTIVDTFDDHLKQLIRDLFATAYKLNGIGIAAPQIGYFKRVAIIHLINDLDRVEKKLVMVNPELTARDGKSLSIEGCLSLPGQGVQARVPRAAKVAIRYRDENGLSCELEAEGLLSRAIQHEIDHLDGIFFVQRAGKAAREMALARFAKVRKHMRRA